MFTADGVEIVDAVPGGHGGARQGSGRKPGGYQKSQEVKDYDKAKARNEAAKAELNELELRIKSGQYLPRTVVIELVATAYAALTQTLRSVPDNLERTKGLPPEICDAIGVSIDEALADIANQFKMLSGDAQA